MQDKMYTKLPIVWLVVYGCRLFWDYLTSSQLTRYFLWRNIVHTGFANPGRFAQCCMMARVLC